MTSRAWHIVRWFGFLAIGLTIAIGSGMRFRAKNQATDGSLARYESSRDSLVAQAPGKWLATEPESDPESEYWSGPLPFAETGSSSEVAIAEPPDTALDLNSPQAEQEIDALGAALAAFDAQNVQVRTIDERGRRLFVFSCDVPTGDGAASFVGEGPDPPSAARQALSRIRSWAAAPSETTLR